MVDGIDRISFSEGDRIEECRILRRSGYGSRCILSVFAIRRASGRLDAFFSGPDGVKARIGVTPEFMKGFFEDVRAAAAEDSLLSGRRTSWEAVGLEGCSTIVEDVEALKKAGLPMWAGADAP